MRVLVFSLIFMLMATLTAAEWDHKSCDRKYKKIGCFLRQERLLSHQLIQTDEYDIDFENFKDHLHSLACQCYEMSVAANYKYFGITAHGSCFAGDDEAGIEKLTKTTDSARNYECFGADYYLCVDNDETECTGTDTSDYIYGISEFQPTKPTPIDGGYGDWSSWSKCDAECGEGQKVRERACNNPLPSKKGKDCQDLGQSTEVKVCKMKDCPSENQIKKNTLINTIPHLSKTWSVSFDVKMLGKIKGWTNIIHCTIGKNVKRYGDRIPGVWAYSSDTSLHVSSAINGTKNFYIKTARLPLNKFVNVKIEQVYQLPNVYNYSIYVDDKLSYSTVNSQPKEFKNVKCYQSDPWYRPSNAEIKNFKHENLKDGYKLKKNHLIEKIPLLGKVWKVSFDLTVLGVINTYGSIIHFTTGENINSYGDRVPAVWTKPGGTKLVFTAPINGKKNYAYSSFAFEKNKMYHIDIEQSYRVLDSTYQYSIYIDGKVVHTIENKDIQSFKNVKVYAADPWYEPANAIVNNFAFENIHDGYKLKKSSLIDTIPVMNKVWTLEFDIMLYGARTSFGSIIHFTNGGNIGDHGNRIPGLWTRQGQTSLQISSSVSGDDDHYLYTKPLPLNKFVHIKIEQIYLVNDVYQFSTYIGEEIYSVQNNHPLEFQNVKVYAGDPWHEAADGVIKNFKFENKHDGFTLNKNNLLEVIPDLGKVWELSFNIKIFEKIKTWGSVVHFTTGENIKTYGDRVPAIWTRPGDTRLCFTAPVNGKKNYIYNSNPLDLEREYKVKVEQKYLLEDKYQYSIYLDDKLIHSIENTKVLRFENVKVYAADPWYEPAKATIKNLKFQNIHDGIALKKGSLVDTIPVLNKGWSVSFNLMLLSKAQELSNVIHFSVGKNHGSYGDRIPAVFVKPGDTTLAISSAVNKEVNHNVGTDPLPLNEFKHIKVEQIYTINDEYNYTVYMNGRKEYSVINKHPQKFENVKVYISDPWHPAANALIKNFEFKNLRDGFSLAKNHLIQRIPEVKKEWKLSFDLKVFGVRKGWGSIIHFTVGEDNVKYGDRIPAVWTRPKSTRLHFASAVNEKKNYIYNSNTLQKNRFYHIIIEQRQTVTGEYRYIIKIDDKEVRSVINKKVQVFKDVKVYTADPWFEQADAVIQNFKFLNGKTVDPDDC